MRSRLGQSDVAGRGRVWRSWVGIWGVVLASGFAAALSTPGCLNPRPEELPSNTSNVVPAPEAAQPVSPVRETCGDNPLLAGCAAELPPVDSNDAPSELGGNGAEEEVSYDQDSPEGDAGASMDTTSPDAGAFTESSADSGGTP